MTTIWKKLTNKLSGRTTAPTDQSSSQNTGEKTTNSTSSEEFINQQIENTPFRIIGDNKQGYAAVIGNHRITPPCPTKKHLDYYLETQYYHIVANMIMAIPQIIKEHTDQLLNETTK